MTYDITQIKRFWDRVAAQDYEAVQQAVTDGFDVNAPIPGKVPPVTFAQSAENMVMLKLLWEAGAHPATPWLGDVFADFAAGGDGSKFKRKKVRRPVGKLILHRFNGDETYALERAVIRVERREIGAQIELRAQTNGTVIKSLPDTQGLHGTPDAWVSNAISLSEVENLVGMKLSVPHAYDENTQDFNTNFYYVEHEPLLTNEIEFVSRSKNRYRVKWTSQTLDVNCYDGSKPDTRVEIEGWFTLEAQDGVRGW